ncbi:MAG: hypothetical protein QXO17_04295 [Nitrososphaerota archaeon]
MGQGASAGLRTLLLLAMVSLGVIYPALTATTVVETITQTVAEPGTTYATVTVIQGGDVIVRIEMPRIRVIAYYERQDQVCVVRFAATTTTGLGGVIAVPGTTIIQPGITTTYVLREPIEITTTRQLPTATTTTGYTIVTVRTAYTLGQFVTTMSVPVSLYGVIDEACNVAFEINRLRIEPERLPATVIFAFRGFTFAFPGYTVTMPDFPQDQIPPELANLRTTVTTTRVGTTEAMTTTLQGTTATLSTRAEGTTLTTTVIIPGRTYVTVLTVTRTIAETGTTTTQTTARQTTTTQVAPTTQPSAGTGQAFDPLILALFAGVAVVVVVGILFAFRRGRP